MMDDLDTPVRRDGPSPAVVDVAGVDTIVTRSRALAARLASPAHDGSAATNAKRGGSGEAVAGGTTPRARAFARRWGFDVAAEKPVSGGRWEWSAVAAAVPAEGPPPPPRAASPPPRPPVCAWWEAPGPVAVAPGGRPRPSPPALPPPPPRAQALAWRYVGSGGRAPSASPADDAASTGSGGGGLPGCAAAAAAAAAAAGHGGSGRLARAGSS